MRVLWLRYVLEATLYLNKQKKERSHNHETSSLKKVESILSGPGVVEEVDKVQGRDLEGREEVEDVDVAVARRATALDLCGQEFLVGLGVEELFNVLELLGVDGGIDVVELCQELANRASWGRGV